MSYDGVSGLRKMRRCVQRRLVVAMNHQRRQLRLVRPGVIMASICPLCDSIYVDKVTYRHGILRDANGGPA